MKIAITGDRSWLSDRFYDIHAPLDLYAADIELVVLGDAKGVDSIARRVCESIGLPFVREEAKWNVFGRAAGPERNGRMLDHLSVANDDEVWYFHDDLDNSKGTKNCVKQARTRGLTVCDGLTIVSRSGS